MSPEPVPSSTRKPGRAHVAGAVGVLGELLITLGVLLALFVAWQLWWTDVEGERAQAAAVASLAWDVEPLPVAEPAEAAPTPHREPAPVLDPPAHATTFATMVVPRWGSGVLPISQGTSKHDVLDALGVGHYEGTAMPGGVGNFALAGHRTTYGKPFNRVEEIQLDDPVVIRTEDTWYVYRVTSTEVVLPTDVQVIAPVPDDPDATPTEALLTMTTCHPMYSARERYVVHGVLDYWLPVSEGTPSELTELAAAPA